MALVGVQSQRGFLFEYLRFPAVLMSCASAGGGDNEIRPSRAAAGAANGSTAELFGAESLPTSVNLCFGTPEPAQLAAGGPPTRPRPSHRPGRHAAPLGEAARRSGF